VRQPSPLYGVERDAKITRNVIRIDDALRVPDLPFAEVRSTLRGN
jgi:hypothetical protein